MRTLRANLSAPLAAAVAALGACGPADGRPPANERGAKLYAAYSCAQCHGPQGAGGPLGPPLADLGRHWDRAGIAAYLSEPRLFLDRDPRLQALEQRFSAQMPSVNLPEEERLALADHVLALSAAQP